MSTIEIRLADNPVDAKKLYMTPEIAKPLAEFLYDEAWTTAVQKRLVHPSLWVAYVDGEPVGFEKVKSRAPLPHMITIGTNGVLERFRRQKIGTALFSAVVFQGVLEGRRLVDVEVMSNTPWMYMGKVAPTLGMELQAVFKERTGTFADMNKFVGKTYEMVPPLIETLIPVITDMELVVGDYQIKKFQENLVTYRRHRPVVADQMVACLRRILNQPWVSFVSGPGSVREAEWVYGI